MRRFKQKLRLLHDTVFYSEQHCNIWMALEECIVKQGGSYEEYFNFLEPSRRAHFVSMLMAVCSIFDTRDGLGRYYIDKETGRDCYGSFIDEIEKYSIINKRTIRKIKTTLRRKSFLIKKARTLRDKNFAHAVLSIEDALKEARLTKKRCASLVKITGELVNEISRACGDGCFGQELHGGDALVRLLVRRGQLSGKP